MHIMNQSCNIGIHLFMIESCSLVGKKPPWMMHKRHSHDNTTISVLPHSLRKTNEGHHLIMAMEPYMYMYIYIYIYVSVCGCESEYLSMNLYVYSSHKILALHPMKHLHMTRRQTHKCAHKIPSTVATVLTCVSFCRAAECSDA